MTDEQVKQTKYTYALNANLVLSGQNRDGGEKQGGRGAQQQDQPTGEGETLVGRKLAGFGDRVVRERPKEADIMADTAGEKKKQFSGPKNLVTTKRESENVMKSLESTHSLKNVNFAAIQIEQELIYRPRTKETQVHYEQLMHMVQRHLGHESIETMKDAVDEILAVLKDDNLNDGQRKAEIDGLLRLERLTDDEFNTMTVLASCLTDYGIAKDEVQERGQVARVSNREQEQDIAIDLDQEDDEVRGQGSGNHQGDALDRDAEVVEESASEMAEIESDEGQIRDKPAIQAGSEDKNGLQSISIQNVDAHWLKRYLIKQMTGLIPEDVTTLETKVMVILEANCRQQTQQTSSRDCEKELTKLFISYNLDQADFISVVPHLVQNRFAVYYGVKISQESNQKAKEELKESMEITQEGRSLLLEMRMAGVEQKRADPDKNLLERADQMIKSTDQQIKSNQSELKVLELDSLKFQQGGRLMANKKCKLPYGSTRVTKPGYEEVYVPAIKKKMMNNQKLIQISQLPSWSRQAFPAYMTELNRIQSALYKAAFETPVNLLVCAPTGAGKTNIAMLACLQLLGEMRSTDVSNSQNRVNFNLRKFKIIYIAPMKALVTEVVGNFQRRLDYFGIKVRELTGDVHLTKQQIEEANIIVTTPEKWDIITRKSGERAYVDLVKLIIIDEVHLLHDSRGPVLESIIARTIRQIEETQELVRIVGLSATLPNYKDVAQLLKVDPDEGLFYFDNSFRPVPLEQIYVGISEKKAIKKVMLMNEVCYQKVIERIDKFQVLVFVHSRKETSRTAKIIRDMAIAQDKQELFVKEDSESKRILMEVIVTKKLAVSQDLKDLVPMGIGIHHAGLSKDDRTLVEDLFAAGHIKVLISTATLAWGVNLPAHTVIIKGTQAYNPELGQWVELSPQDILQMMGRAGRPQYDTQGEGIIITNHADLQYYLSLNNQQLPIESQMIQALPDQLNAEIVQGSVTSLREAVLWLSYTYLHIRMRKNPSLYGVQEEDRESDGSLLQVRRNLAHSAALKLQRSGMVNYDKRSGALMATALGKVASHYYVKCESMLVYNEELKPHMSTIDIFRLFATSREFQNIPIRENEKVELQKFIDRVPIPVKGGIEEPSTKINILLQSYIARFRLEGFDLNSDLVFVTQSASRIMRALFEIAVKKGWAQLSENLLNICKMVDRRQWYCATPLRQFASVLEGSGISQDVTMAQDLQEIARRIERKDQFKWTDLSDFSAQRLGELIKYPKMGKIIQGYVQKFPRLNISAFVQPITRSTARIELEVKAHESFQWDGKFHGKAETFWIFVSDGDCENILHSEQFILYESQTQMEHHLSFTVPLFDPLPPHYFIKVISDRWLQAEHVIPVSFQNLVLPDKYAALTKLHGLQQKPVTELDFEEAEDIYVRFEGMKEFSPIQSQAFDQLYLSDDSVFLGVPQGGSESRILAELAIFRELQKENLGKIVYVSPNFQHCLCLHEIWSKRLGSTSEDEGLGLCVELISNDTPGSIHQDLQQLKKADVVIATSAKWESLTQKWRSRPALQQVSLYIFAQLHLIHDTQSQQTSNSASGQAAQYEVLLSRIRYIQTELKQQGKQPVRLVALSAPVATAKDLCDWMGINFDRSCFNFGPSVRESCPSLGPLQVNIQSFDHNGRRARLCQMIKPTYNQIKQCFTAIKNRGKGDLARALVFTSDLKHAQSLALDLVNYCIADESDHLFRGKPAPKDSPLADEDLRQLLDYGVAWAHSDLPESQLRFLKKCFVEGAIKVLVATFNTSWCLEGADSVKADLVVIMDPQVHNALEKRSQTISISTIIQMQSLAISNELNLSRNTRARARSIIMCHGPLKDYFAKYISEPLPLESLLPQNLHQHLNSTVASSEVQNVQECIDWITWTFMYRRISKNPNYYEIAGRSGQHINDYLSELVEDTVAELAETGCLAVHENEIDLEVANLGRIAAYYCLDYQTVEIFARSFNFKTAEGAQQPIGTIKLKQILEILSQASEITDLLQALEVDDLQLRQLALNLPIDINRSQDFTDPPVIANILIQCHLSRRSLQTQASLQIAQKSLLPQALNLTHAMIDVICSSLGSSLKPAILCMELSQMLVQAMWTSQSPLLQLPFLNSSKAEALRDGDGVQDIADLMNMEDERRDAALGITEKQMAALAAICNRYPNNELEISNAGSTDVVRLQNQSENENIVDLDVILRRDIQEEDFESKEEYLEELKIFRQPVSARFYPKAKDENWWIVAGHVATGKLLSIKKIQSLQTNPRAKQTLSLPITAQLMEAETESNIRKGTLPIKVYAVCDSYIGCDLEKDFCLRVSNESIE